MLPSCRKGTVGPEKDDVVNVILDSDFGSSTDDMVAALMLYNYAKAGKVNLLGIIVDRYDKDCYNAAVADVMNYAGWEGLFGNQS